MEPNARIFVAGGQTLIGSAIVRQLKHRGYTPLPGEPDLLDALDLTAFFERERPEYVFYAAGKSGGIQMNQQQPATLIYNNILSATNVIDRAWRHNVTKLLYLASSCSYPRGAPQPMTPESLMTGPLEPTNEAYAMAKLAGMATCAAYRQQYSSNFIIGIPADAFGPGDDFSLENSHVVAALMLKMHLARTSSSPSVEVWGTGTPRREFMYVDDLADACIFAMDHYNEAQPINLGGGADLSIAQLAEAIQTTVGFEGTLEFNTDKPDGMPLKRLDAGKLAGLGWSPRVGFEQGLKETYRWLVEHHVSETARV